MTYEEALSLARKGDDRGFNFLYQSTYQEKHYLALKYMKNKEDAEDVMQMAYIKAFEKLDTLEKADAFPGWFGTIVANTAKNELVKKNPVLFSDLAVDEEGESFELEVEDENPENQPELSYTRQETVDLVREMIGALSEEQKMCVLMFHIEGQSIREIAEAMGCSENTVKSRLRYARKNLELQGVELEKKGYKLYSVAPITLLLLLLRKEESLMAANGELELPDSVLQQSIAQAARTVGQTGTQAAGETTAQSTATQTGEAGAQTAGETAARTTGEAAAQSSGQTAGEAAAKAAGETAAKGILQTVGGKIALGACVCLLGAGAAVGIHSMNADQPEETVIEETEDTVEEETETEMAEEAEEVIDELGTTEETETAEYLEWRVEGSTLYISVIGRFPDRTSEYVSEDGLYPWEVYTDEANEVPYTSHRINDSPYITMQEGITAVVFEEGLVEFSDVLFLDRVTSITFPSTLTSIPDNFFGACAEWVTDLVLPEGVIEIGEKAFRGCNDLQTITIYGENVVIKDGAFCRCDSLTDLYVYGSIASIGDAAFELVLKNEAGAMIIPTVYIVPEMTIHAASGSYAETYAAENGFAFEAVD